MKLFVCRTGGRAEIASVDNVHYFFCQNQLKYSLAVLNAILALLALQAQGRAQTTSTPSSQRSGNTLTKLYFSDASGFFYPITVHPTNNTEPHTSQVYPAEGFSLHWKGNGSYPGASITSTLSVQDNVIIMHVVGSVAVDKNGMVNIGCSHYLGVDVPAGTRSIHAESHIFGNVDATASVYGAGVGNVLHNLSVKASAGRDHPQDSKSQPIDVTQPFDYDFTSRSMQLNAFIEPFRQSGTSGYHRPQGYRQACGVSFSPALHAEANTDGNKSGHGEVALNLTMIVRFSVNGEPLPPTPVVQTPSIELIKATTTDAASVSVDYTINGQQPPKSIDFKFFRSSTPDLAKDPSGSLLLGENVDTQSGDLSSGNHTVTFLKGVDLPPDAKHPYIVVVATSGTDKSSIYFRKWRLATVAHGYAGYDTLLDPGAQSRTVAWVNAMADYLKGFQYCDDVIRYLWVADSIAEKPNMTTVNGKRLALQIQQYISSKSASHPGDVVDLLMIGHSRGTVITSQALQNLTAKDLAASDVAVVLLDCHPANKLSNPPDHVTCDFSGEAASKRVVRDMNAIEYLTFFQNTADDPEIVIPGGLNIKSIDIWWQHTTVQWLKRYQPRPEAYLNLWGISSLDRRITNNSGIAITWHNATTNAAPATNSPFPIGHEEIHELYKNSLPKQIH